MDTPREYVLKRRDGTIVVSRYGSIGAAKPGQYPSEVIGNPPAKPVLRLPQGSYELDNLKARVMSSFNDSRPISHDLVNLFLYKFLETLNGNRLSAEWTSFGITIGRAGQTIKPMDLVTVVFDLPQIQFDAKINPTPPMAVALLALGSFRLARCNESKNKLLDELKTLYARLSGGTALPNFDKVHGMVLSNDKNFQKICAAVDMFVDKFVNAEITSLRFGTLDSRYRGCTALVITRHIEEKFFGGSACINRWSLAKTLIKEYSNLTRPNQEIDKIDSYMPYILDFGIVTKSPYSVKLNPSINLLINIVGTFMQLPRYYNAKKLDCPVHTDILKNGLFIAYAIAKSGNPERQLVGPDNSINPEPATADPDAWIDWFERYNFLPSNEMKSFARNRTSGITFAQQTVGEWVKNQYIQ
uniref:Rhabdovirus nucleocapsid domain-containing protein n=1 Tax=Tetranychus urticae TaxID=32264 RepID=T1KD13_TETUR